MRETNAEKSDKGKEMKRKKEKVMSEKINKWRVNEKEIFGKKFKTLTEDEDW